MGELDGIRHPSFSFQSDFIPHAEGFNRNPYYLSSYRLGDHPQELRRLARGGQRTALIRHVVDHLPDPERRLQRDLDDLQSVGLLPGVLSLRQRAEVERLAEFDSVFVRGGNTFVLRQALAEAGADDFLGELLRQDALVYAGFSAGGCVLSPDLREMAPIDHPDALARPLWTGLGILDRPFVPT